MILHVMDETFAYKGRIENHISLRWKEQYQGKGMFTMIVDDTEQNAAMLQRGRILLRGDRKTAMLIVKITRNSADNTIHLYGHTYLAMLERRVIPGPYKETNLELLIVKSFAENRRKLPITTASTGIDVAVEEDTEIKDADMLPTYIDLCEKYDVGIKIHSDYRTRIHTLQVYRGRDLAYKEGEGGMVFSLEFGNMLSVTVEEDDSLFKNICYVRGTKKDDTEILLEVGEAGEYERREMIIQGSIQKDDQSDADYTALLTKEGRDALQENYDVANFTAEISPEKLGTAFDLGDLVTCNATRYGVRFDARITEFEETFEQGFRKVYITMGKPTITYAKAILAQAKKGKVK